MTSATETNNRTTLPRRNGPHPRTTAWAPHVQHDQLAPPAVLEALATRVFSLPDADWALAKGHSVVAYARNSNRAAGTTRRIA